MSSVLDQIHAQACEVCARYKRAEVELVSVLQQVEQHRVFLKRGHSSLFSYVTAELGLSEHTAYDLITVARKACEVPALQARLQDGSLTLSKCAAGGLGADSGQSGRVDLPSKHAFEPPA